MKIYFGAKLALTIFLSSFFCLSVNAQVIPKKGAPPQRIYGLTIENLNELDVDKFREKFKDVTVPITLRVVFQANTSPSDYEAKLSELHNPPQGKKKFYILALPFDSYALRHYQLNSNPNENFDCKNFAPTDPVYDHRAKCFVEYFKGEKDYIDAWEVGNEVNGEWADEAYQDGVKLPPETKGKPEITVEKINRLISFIPAHKPIMLTVSYMPNCLEWTANAMDQWINNFPQTMIDKLDYVLVSYYENNCDFRVLSEEEINRDVFGTLRRVFKNQFLGMGEIGYSDGDDEDFETCKGNENCYCSKDMENCNRANCIPRNDKMACCRKSKIAQMQRYYGMKPSDSLYIGGGFWWNAGTDYKIGDFRKALKRQFTCLATNQQCEKPLPVDCR
ncbi:MAG TPA: hypothetical protein VF543_02565 [Pyrinomonadaceae bacterium]|jgi:hypothetical protein